jgi:hypothetical protein
MMFLIRPLFLPTLFLTQARTLSLILTIIIAPYTPTFTHIWLITITPTHNFHPNSTDCGPYTQPIATNTSYVTLTPLILTLTNALSLTLPQPATTRVSV